MAVLLVENVSSCFVRLETRTDCHSIFPLVLHHGKRALRHLLSSLQYLHCCVTVLAISATWPSSIASRSFTTRSASFPTPPPPLPTHHPLIALPPFIPSASPRFSYELPFKSRVDRSHRRGQGGPVEGCRVPRGWGTSGKNLKDLQTLLDQINDWQPKVSDLVLEDGVQWVAARITNSQGVKEGFVLVDGRGGCVLRRGAAVTTYKRAQSATVYPSSFANVTIAHPPTPPPSRRKRSLDIPSSAVQPAKKTKPSTKTEWKEEKEREEKHIATNDWQAATHPSDHHQRPATSRLRNRPHAAPRKLALVVGCSQYLRHSPLPAAKTDAEQMFLKLQQLGYDVTVQIDPSSLYQCFAAFFNHLSPNDSVLVYYAGHAGQKGGVNQLLQVDGKKQVSLSELHDQIKHKRLHRVGFIIDACRDEEAGARLSRYADWKLPDAENSFFSFACGPYTRAVEEHIPGPDGKRHGRYTRALLDHINNVDDIQLIMRRVCATVSEISDGKQRPWHHECIMTEKSLF